MLRNIFLIAVSLLAALPGAAQRKPVLPQIDLPHPYYYREMYLPQLTSGPSSVTWSPDSQEVIYSMAGSLWRQKINSTTAVQLTDGLGYDYQPDWSPDGNQLVYCTYLKDALELWLLDLESGKAHQITRGGAVNVEPRWSPDGTRIVFVSTLYNKRFHIFTGDVRNGQLEDVIRLTGETKSSLPRYYYSAYDTEINPTWSRDGKEILFVSNRGHIYGTGGFWQMKAQPRAKAREIHYEETTWKARPDFSPDGSRIVYSSYLGRNWQQIWVMPSAGGDAFPLSYGEWDHTNVRWSPDGKRLAFISNESGNTELRLQTVPGNETKTITADRRVYRRLRSRLLIKTVDSKGEEVAARVSVTGEDGRFYAPNNAWIHADDRFDRNERNWEAHYFHSTVREATVVGVPAGKITIDAMKGFEYHLERRVIDIREGQSQEITIQLKSFDWNTEQGRQWVSGDLHVHMNYSGIYHNTPGNLVEQAAGENLGIVNNLIVNKEQRFPDIAYSGRQVDPASSRDVLLVHGQEFHTSYWGHLGLLNIQEHILLPGYAGYPRTAASSLFPMNAEVADMAHAQGAVVGYVHPFDEEPQPLSKPDEPITDELPVDVALGKVDYMEILGFSDHRSTANVWYRLLNLGFRIPAGAGTDAMANFASLRGPLGMNRVYAWVPDSPVNVDSWLDALKKGRTFATNGPLLNFTLGGQAVGDDLKFKNVQENVTFTAKLRSIVPIDALEVVCNGRVVSTLTLNPTRDSADVRGVLPLKQSGWCVLRASSDASRYPVLDNYVYATTSPIYVTVGGKVPSAPEDAKYFSAWIAHVIAATSRYQGWNSSEEKETVLKQLTIAKGVFDKLR